MNKKECFPDGTVIDEWFYDTEIPTLEALGERYDITRYSVKDDGKVYTKEIQSVIDEASEKGGGVVFVPKGKYRTGALFFKRGVHLCLEEGATLEGSDDISDYPVMETRIEGETCLYYPALINADGVDGFTICGKGTIDGNGWRSWKAFWQRRQWNPNCTNKDEQRPRLLYISRSRNVLIANLSLQNSHFWTTHIYRCERVKYLNCTIKADVKEVRAPSSDAIDIDACRDVLIKNCYFEVNDDSVVLKGGKGPWADVLPENGGNERILVEDCRYGFCHGVLTCGSESIHNKNILVRRGKVDYAGNLLWLKMRPDTPQLYEYITLEDFTGYCCRFLNATPWTQFYDLKGRKDIPLSYVRNITIRNTQMRCEDYFVVKPERSQYLLSDFTLEHLKIQAKQDGFDPTAVENIKVDGVEVTVVE